ncbi:hypothetical protein U9M48_023635 [Paspalum notatum var. saurae]|uniref:Chromo domain-containing protein n=1 Tax=Paspalum notatum var. saurae TaxID=547442 RepID=A0AAQ3WW65_PASNO
MLRACAIQYGTGWDKSLPYAEFSYNNGYQAGLKKSPFEALCMAKVRDTAILEPNGREARCSDPTLSGMPNERIKMVRENLRVARSGRKSYADVSPMRGIRRFNMKGKLGTKIHRSIQDSGKKRRRCGRTSTTLEGLDVREDLTYTEHPVKILETSERVTRNRRVKMCRVQWKHHTEDEATWEREEELRATYSGLFANHL